MKKQILASVLSAMLLSTVFAGCGGSSSANSGTSEGNEQSTELKLLYDYWNADVENDPAKLALEEKTGYQLSIEVLPSGAEAASEKINLLLASNAEFDIVRLSATTGIFAQSAQNGYLQSLDEQISKYDNILNAYPEDKLDLGKVNGTLYGFPMAKNDEGTSVGMIYRKDMIDSANLTVPDTADAFKEFLKELKSKYPDSIPLALSDNVTQASNLSSAFGFSPSCDWYEVDGEMVPMVKMPGFVEYVRYLQDLYNEGLLDPEFSSNSQEIIQQKLSTGKVIVTDFPWWYWQCLDTARKNIDGFEYESVPVLKNESGETIVSANTGIGADSFMCIAKTSTNPDGALDFINKVLEPETYDYIANGTEGEEYTVEGESFASTDKYSETRLNSWWFLPGTNYELRPKTFVIGIAGEHPDVLGVWEKINAVANEEYYVDPTLSMSQSAVYGKNKNALSTMANDYVIQTIANGEDVDKAYEKFIKVWDMEGGTETVEDVNRIYQEEK